MTMTEKFKILAKYIKDLSSETPDIETYLFVKNEISKYQLGIDITSKALKNKMIEVNTKFKFGVIKIDEKIKDKKELEKIILCDLQIKIYPDLEKALIELLHNSGYPGIKFEKKVDFESLYKQRFN